MATDELTANDAFRAALIAAELITPNDYFNPHVYAMSRVHEALTSAIRADRDRLREERDSAVRKAQNLYLNCAEDTAKLREEIAAKDAEIQRLTDENELCEFCEAPENPNGDNATGGDSLKVCHGCIHRRHAWAVSLGQKLAAPADEGKTCAPMEDWRGANEDWRKR